MLLSQRPNGAALFALIISYRNPALNAITAATPEFLRAHIQTPY
jgi:hypothetical protein